MGNSSAASALFWDEQQRVEKAQKDLEHPEWLKNFALLFALIVLTLSVATVLANLGANGTIGL
jgi:hypothetical protein